MESASVLNQSCGSSTTTPPMTLSEFTMSALGQCCNQEETDGIKTLLYELIVTRRTRGARWYRGQWCRKSSDDGARVIGGRETAWALVPEQWRQ